MSVRTRWHRAAEVLATTRDLLEDRSEGATSAPLDARAWTPFLLGLDNDALAALESRGVDAAWPSATPPSLQALLDDVRAVCTLPMLTSAPAPVAARAHERPRKTAQIDAFARLVVPLAARAEQVLDVGSGHGHLTREIAERVGRPVIGFERNEALAERARSLVKGARASQERARVSFAIRDVLTDGLELSRDDCVIGLHACGELGDVVVTGAARAGASVALVGCCLQKQRTPSRVPLARGTDLALLQELTLPKRVLGLSNLSTRTDGVEASLAENLAARERRVALHRLLADAGVPLAFGAELEGLNRRAAHLDVHALVARAFTLRALAVPSPAAIEAAARWAHEHHARMRRLSLPRTLLARVLEVFVLLDRARFLEEHGYAVAAGVVFPAEVSARNLALTAARA